MERRTDKEKSSAHYLPVVVVDIVVDVLVVADVVVAADVFVVTARIK